MVMLLSLYSLVIYGLTLKNGFVWDSNGVFVDNAQIKSFSTAIKSFFGSKFIGENFTYAGAEVKTLEYYRPLTTLFHYIEYSVFADNVFWYKFVNLILNSFVVVAAFFLVRELTQSNKLAFVSSLFYASIPARGEVVYWAYSDSHIFAALFILLALILYIKKRYVVACLVFLAGILFQEAVILLLPILITYEYSYVKFCDLNILKRLVPFSALVIIYLFVRAVFVGQIPLKDLHALGYLNLASEVVYRHIKIFFLQDNAVTIYRYDQSLFSSQILLFKVLLLFFVGGVLLYFFLKNRQMFFWLVLFFVVLPLSVVGGSYYYYAEKALYLSSLGLAVFLVFGAYRIKSNIALCSIAFLIVINSVSIVNNAAYWTDTVTYLKELVRFDPDFDIGIMQLGNEHLAQKNYEPAIDSFDKALKVRPDLGKFLQNRILSAYQARAYEKYSSKEYLESISGLENYVEKYGDHPEVFNSIGNNFFALNEYALAASYYEKALEMAPGNRLYEANLSAVRRAQHGEK